MDASGVTVSAFGAVLAGDCRRHAPGVTFPRVAGAGPSLDGLGRCARELKRMRPNETQAVVTAADPTLPYRELVAVLDAVRADAAGEMFTELALGVEPTGGAAPSAQVSATQRP